MAADTNPPNPPSLRYLVDAMETLNTICPRKSIISWMRMTKTTRDRLISRIHPCIVSTCGMSTEQLIALEFNGVQIRVNEEMPEDVIEIYNVDNELMQRVKL